MHDWRKATEYLHSELSGTIIKAFYNVYNVLSYGFLEKVYENAMIIELAKFDLICQQQKSIDVFYGDQKVGQYFADLIVNDCIIVELKAAEALAYEHECQLLNYLKATEIEVGLLLNFGKKPEHKRKVFTNDKKRKKIKADR